MNGPRSRSAGIPVVGGGTFVFDEADIPASVWGDGEIILWAQGEPLLITGPDGVGKTTVTQQLALRRAGIVQEPFLGFTVAPDDRPVLYLAADRVAQAERSLRRMVDEADRDSLDQRLLVHRGLLDYDLTDHPEFLAEGAAELGVGTVIVDSLKDVARDLSSDESGSAVARAFQALLDKGIELVVVHHTRKTDDQRYSRPRSINDVYGSRWIFAKCGSVVLIWGNPGDDRVTLQHLKQPAASAGRVTLIHDHAAGTTTAVEPTAPAEQLAGDQPTLRALLLAFATANPGQPKTAPIKDEAARTKSGVRFSRTDALAEYDRMAADGLVRLVDGKRRAQLVYPINDRFPLPENQ